MWPFSRQARLEKLRKAIEMDGDLTPEQKKTALTRLNDKEEGLTNRGDHPFGLEKIADENQKMFNSLLPDIVGRIQLKRLRTRNEMIQEMRRTLNELAETKKSWERLKNIDEEVAFDRMMAYQKGREAQDEHAKKIETLTRETAQIRRGKDQDKAEHELRMTELELKRAELENKKRNEPEPTKSQAELLKEEHELKKLRLTQELELEEIRLEAERKRGRGERAFDSMDNYRAAEDAIKETGLTGEELKRAINRLRREFNFNRDPDSDSFD